MLCPLPQLTIHTHISLHTPTHMANLKTLSSPAYMSPAMAKKSIPGTRYCNDKSHSDGRNFNGHIQNDNMTEITPALCK